MKILKKLTRVLSVFVLIHSAVEVQAIERTVKVAFLPEMYGFYTMEENGGFSGYNHDYLMNLAQYSQWHYEYVVIEEGSIDASFAKAEEMLLAGEIDLLGSVFGTNKNMPLYEVGKKNYSVARYNLYSLRNNYEYTGDRYFLQDKVTSALVTGYEELNQYLYDLVAGRYMNYEYIYVDSYRDSFSLLMDGTVDNIISLDMSKDSQYLTNLTTVHRVPIYFVSTKGNVELIAELDEAISKMEIVSPTIQESLFETYFGIKYDDKFLFREEELMLLEKQRTFTVGYVKNAHPYQYIDEDGRERGISFDILQELSEILEIELESVWFDTLDDLYQAMMEQTIDITPALPYDFEITEYLPVTLTDPYLSNGVYWLSPKNPSENLEILYHYVSDNIPFYHDNDLSMTIDIEEAIRSMSKNENIAIFCDPNVAEYYLDYLKINNIDVSSVSDVRSKISIGVGSHIDISLIAMLNRGILFLDSYEVDKIIYNNSVVEHKFSMNEFLSNFAREIILLVLVISSMIIYSVDRNGKKFKDLSRRDGMTKLYNSGYFHEFAESKVPTISAGALILIDIDWFKQVNDVHGHQMGDEIIKLVAENVVKHGKPLGTVARLGGYEFVALIDEPVEKSQLEESASHLLHALMNNRSNIPVTLSIGGFLFQEGSDYQTIYKKADEVLYVVKERGRNGYAFYSEEESENLRGLSSFCMNYISFQERVTGILADSEQEQHHVFVSLKIFDLENLIKVHGTPLVSDYLEVIGKRLKRQIKATDLLGSQEEDTFLIMLQFNGDRNSLNSRLESMQSTVAKEVFLGDKVLSGTLKVGTAMFPEEGRTLQDLLTKLK